MRKWIATACAVLLAGLTCQVSAGNFESGYDFAVDAKGNISLPDADFRATWTMLGSWTVNGDDGAKAIHVVYTQPGVAESYRKSGKFPDGAVLIKELLSAETGSYTTGNVSHAKEISGWFVMVKDDQQRFKGNKLWGDGWGWAYFDPADRKNTTTKDYKTECQGCHIPAEKNDWIYIEGYPVLGEK